MLWYRFWLETRLRLIFVVVWSAFFFGVGLYPVANRPAALCAAPAGTSHGRSVAAAWRASGSPDSARATRSGQPTHRGQ